MVEKTGGVNGISAVTLQTVDMARAVEFYESLGLTQHRGGPSAPFTSFSVGQQHVNLRLVETHSSAKNTLIIFRVDDVDEVYKRVISCHFTPEFPPRDADWGERYFHILDPDGNLLSFAQPL
ncbi:MAG: VOC family protein [Planctomycetales bacterium]|nr:VOC family protein [Planctomycetales bacterium]